MGAVMVRISVTVIDANALFRAGVASLLSQIGFARVDEAKNVIELIRRGRDSFPDIVLSDLPEGLRGTIDTIRQIENWGPKVKVVFLANDFSIETLRCCYAAGASGVLPRSISRDALAANLKLVRAGENVFPSDLASLLPGLKTRINSLSSLQPFNLSDRELTILRCLIDGQSNKLIAATLDIAECTVKVQLQSILKKTGARNRTQAAIWAFDRCRDVPVVAASAAAE